MRRVLRADLLDFTADPGFALPNEATGVRWRPDHLVLIEDGRIHAVQPAAQAVPPGWQHVTQEDHAGRLLTPGFIDTHVHCPQLDVIASFGTELLDWLNTYTFPAERRYADPAVSQAGAQRFLNALWAHGTTSAVVFPTVHKVSAEALFEQAGARQMRLVTGKVLMNRHAPDGLRDDVDQAERDCEDLIARFHGQHRQAFAVTVRFAPTSTPEQLRGAGELAARYPSVWVQSHVAENRDEVRWAAELFPHSRSYLGVYDDFGLLRERAVYAHCIHLNADDRALMRETGAAAAVSPTSNLFLGSGFFDYAAADAAGMRYGLASDVGGGTSFSPFHTMLAAYYVGREGQSKTGLSLTPGQLWWQHTAGAAQALGLTGVVGNLQPGNEADFVVLNPQATPLLARKTAQANSLDELLFALIVLGDDRVVERTVIAGP